MFTKGDGIWKQEISLLKYRPIDLLRRFDLKKESILRTGNEQTH